MNRLYQDPSEMTDIFHASPDFCQRSHQDQSCTSKDPFFDDGDDMLALLFKPPSSTSRYQESNCSWSPHSLQNCSVADVSIQSDNTEPIQRRKSSKNGKKTSNGENEPPSDDHKVLKTKTNYNRTWGVKVLKDWCESMGYDKDFEYLEATELNKLLEKFWKNIRRSDSTRYRSSSLSNLRAMINGHLKDNVNFDIVTDKRFGPSNDAYEKECKGLGKQIEHKKPISVDDLQQLYISETLSNDNPWSLLRKVWFEINLHFCHKGSQKLNKLTKDTFEVRTDPKTGLRYIARKDSAMHNEDIRMMGTQNELDPVTSFQLYIQKLHPEQSRLFQQPRKKVDLDAQVWYGKSPIGAKALQQMMSNICDEAVLDTRYTNHCVKTTNVQTYFAAMSAERMTKEWTDSSYLVSKILAENNRKEKRNVLDQSEEMFLTSPALNNQSNDQPQSLYSQQLRVSCENSINIGNGTFNLCNNQVSNKKPFSESEYCQAAQNMNSLDHENFPTPDQGLMDSPIQNDYALRSDYYFRDYLTSRASSLSSYSSPDYTASLDCFKQPMEKTKYEQPPFLSPDHHSQPTSICHINPLSSWDNTHQSPGVNAIAPFASRLQPLNSCSSNPVNDTNNFKSHFAEPESVTAVAGQRECNNAIAYDFQHDALQNQNMGVNDVSNVNMQGYGVSPINMPQNQMSHFDQQSSEMHHHLMQENVTDQYQIQAHHSPAMPTSGSIPLTIAQESMLHNMVSSNCTSFVSPFFQQC